MNIECKDLAICVLVVVLLCLLASPRSAREQYVGKTPYGLDPVALAAVTGVHQEHMHGGSHVDEVAMAATRAHEMAGRPNTESNPRLLSMMMDPRYKQYGAGRGGLYHY